MQDANLIKVLKESIANNLENGWANFSPFTQYLNANYPNIKPKNYGYAKWRTLIEKLELFELKQVNKTTLFIREKSNNSQIQKVKTINNQQLLDDITQIINENPMRTDEWLHIGTLGGQLKQKGYNPKNFGLKTFTALLENTNGVINKRENGGIFFTLKDKSGIKPIETIKSDNYESFGFYNSDGGWVDDFGNVWWSDD